MLRLRLAAEKGLGDFLGAVPASECCPGGRRGWEGVGTKPECTMKSTDTFLSSVSRMQMKSHGTGWPAEYQSGSRRPHYGTKNGPLPVVLCQMLTKGRVDRTKGLRKTNPNGLRRFSSMGYTKIVQNKPIEVIRLFINDLGGFYASFSTRMFASSGRSIKEFRSYCSGRAPWWSPAITER